jgi:hypothetical protein
MESWPWKNPRPARIGNPKAFFAPLAARSADGRPAPVALAAPPARCSSSPERPAARHSAPLAGAGHAAQDRLG